ncbi:MAG: hypothetical protein CMJ24_10350 [Phycisphaerae bacterium]|nr:hypothetical protein [Phycisphaerae bacterium]|tara:strand:+ start:33286 stop:34242 length:957 start_codon:yes stop_codon:yes gene_type:complete
MSAESYLSPETLSQLAPFDLRARMIVDGIRSGSHQSPLQGMSVEFEQHRQYVPGDDLRHLDWKVYGRSDRLAIKQYEQETTLDVSLLVDCSASMSFGTMGIKKGWGGTEASRTTGSWTKFDHATATATALAWMSLQQSDRIGLTMFADGIIQKVGLSSNTGQWRRIVSLLSGQPVDETTDIEKTTEQILSTTTNRSLFIIISDFLQDPGSIRSAMARFRHRKHDVICLQILDRDEMRFEQPDPSMFVGLEGDDRIRIDPPAIRQAYLDALHAHQNELNGMLSGFGFDYHTVDSHDSVGPALAYLIARRTAWSRKHHAS